MDVYIFQAALICEDCSQSVQGALVKPAHVDMDDESSYDSDEWPKGPYADGGGEADSPHHCDMCGVFLDNPLTPDGESYIWNLWEQFIKEGRGNVEVLKLWADAYDWVFSKFCEEREPIREREAALCGPGPSG